MINKLLIDLYYASKPLIPRYFQLFLRKKLIFWKLRSCSDIWPIDHNASKLPEKWLGWPDGKKFALVLTHDADTQKGHDNSISLMRIEQNLGFYSSFNIVPERYKVSAEVRNQLVANGFEVGVHDLKHDGKLYASENKFRERAQQINFYLKEWGCVGFRAGAMHCNLDWQHLLNIEYDASTFDTDPFEPKPEGRRTIFPFWVESTSKGKGYVELPYTMPQDFTLFVLMRYKNIDIWKKKLDWVAEHGGMVLLNTHPDYMNFDDSELGREEYPVQFYEELLEYIKTKYDGQYWHVLPREMARFWSDRK